MKNPQSIFFTLSLIFLSYSCTSDFITPEDEVLLIPRSTQTFEFEVQKKICIQKGHTYSVIIEKPEEYFVLWEVDHKPGGHALDLDCVCGVTAQIHVRRLSDGLQLTKELNMSICDGGIVTE